MPTLFLLSPARTDGLRAAQLARSSAPLGVALRAGEAALGEVFAWLSALYFRGKLAYARAFADASPGAAASLVMAPVLGLRRPETPISAAHLAAMATMDVKSGEFAALLRRDAEVVRDQLATDAQVVLLGSIASDKYVATLLDVFGERLMFPSAFIGRGDMSRGGLLLRASRDGSALDYAPLANATRRGRRPPKLPPLRR
jgi:hypothetical protein